MSPNQWRESSCSAAVDNRVEVADLPGSVAVRDSKHPTRPLLNFGNSAWASFIRGIKKEETL
ncbi:hypothetical protein F4561_001823 [Lipingzhangella halophila]|uniref:DUF397 domain-containing protein n=1 Tax=Lipingzhangella halophila TaxID=1783352 RepID=A0A7W7W241_9ACTN|nr:DUF397 domain-containing protein [Lipingzhangella halophila]MBB4931003.1 hypothetical protein [Lipingzhangella halophila]